MSDADKARMRRQAEDLAKIETDDPGTVERRRQLAALGNELRRQIGAPPLPNPDEEPPELEFFRRAKALGMARIDH